MSNINKKLNLDKDTLEDLYINKKMTSQEIADIFNCTSKSVRNYLKSYNIPIRPNGEAVSLQRSHWTDEQEKARSLKFMQTWQDTPEEIKQEITKRRTANINSPEAIQKAKETKLKNNTYTKSKAEDNFYEQLKSIFADSDIIRGYIDPRYPFNCDFYIKSRDLFIEYQGHQTHGYEPYDPLNPNHWDYLEKQEQLGYDMHTWTVRDPNKLKIAKQNNIMLLLIYPKNNSYLLKNKQLKNLGKINVIDINDIN